MRHKGSHDRLRWSMIHAESAGHRTLLIIRFLTLIGIGAVTIVLLEYWKESTPRSRTRKAIELGLVWDRMAAQGDGIC